ncbi:MAG TPA: single-stranded DNA-binding protein, partial [bacterium]|nr:single-stranded DNA-binding protein [bacterium]
AEAAGEYLKKGDPIFVEGRLQSKSWETEDGQKRSSMEVVADRVQFLNRGKGGDTPLHGVDEEAAGPAAAGASEEDIPF